MSVLRPVTVLALLWLASGCSNDGSYQVSWTFFNSVDDMRAFAPGDCGKTGVSGILITGTNSDGSQDRPVVPCAPGTYTRGLPAGSWKLVLTAVDAEGHLKEPAASDRLNGAPVDVTVTAGKLATVPGVVFLRPLPQCRDGVDNDRDGRVDLDDLDCAGDPLGPDGPCEGTVPGSPECPDTSP